MNDPTRKAMVVLITQIKNTLLSLEDILLSTACEFSHKEFPEPKAPKKSQFSTELNAEEETELERSLEQERQAILGSDQVLKDLWANKGKINAQ